MPGNWWRTYIYVIKYQKNIARKETVKKYLRHSAREEARNSRRKYRGKLIFKRLDSVDIDRNDLIGGTSHQSAGLSCLLVAKHECLHIAESESFVLLSTLVRYVTTLFVLYLDERDYCSCPL